jgi:hypothetical protein
MWIPAKVDGLSINNSASESRHANHDSMNRSSSQVLKRPSPSLKNPALKNGCSTESFCRKSWSSQFLNTLCNVGIEREGLTIKAAGSPPTSL